ncbi:DUF2269 family protein [uncultured Paenibacillus sp.]|uniref:DUF2269 family protein n=1 Tax=uncultured Paenibacillus sp. TaxID=227322 RepID=UPI0028D8348C|nr:DUF2269 family protein [uncultured Paenibacillus sp.]
MKWLVLIHILTAIIGVGPTFFGHVLVRKNQSVGDLKQSLKLSKMLEFFPKIGGSIAVLTGLLLVILYDYTFSSFWIYASLILYVLIQVVVIGIVAPQTKKLNAWSSQTSLSDSEALPAETASILKKSETFYTVASAMGVLLFALMILKPVLG